MAGLFIIIVAILLHVEQMYLMAMAILLIPLVAWVLGFVLTRGITCERSFPLSSPEGGRVTVILRITNTARLPRFYIRAYDTLPAWLLRLETKIPIILQLEPGETRELIYHVEAVKRGAYQVGPLRIQTTDPFGLTRFGHVIDNSSEMLVLPTPLILRRAFLEGGAFGWRGDQEGSRRGSGMDFYGVRDFRSGDELRRVHWRTTARTGRLVVAEQTQGEATHAIVALDVQAEAYRGCGEGKESPIEYAVRIAATLIDDMVRAGHTVQLLTPDPASALEFRREHGVMPLMERLARVEPNSTQSLAQTLTDHVALTPQGSTLICLTPVADPSLKSALSEYIAMGVPASVFLLDRDSFGAKHGRSGGKETAKNTVLPGKVVRVGQGDDLVGVIESMGYARG